MLSGETAKGIYPVEAVKMMHSICLEAEAAVHYNSFFADIRYHLLSCLLFTFPFLISLSVRDVIPKPTSTSETIASSAVNAALEQVSSLSV